MGGSHRFQERPEIAQLCSRFRTGVRTIRQSKANRRVRALVEEKAGEITEHASVNQTFSIACLQWAEKYGYRYRGMHGAGDSFASVVPAIVNQEFPPAHIRGNNAQVIAVLFDT